MPKVKTRPPQPTKDKGQRSLQLPIWFHRYLPLWQQPAWYDAEMWRRIVARQPFALACRETLISNYIALDWTIEAKDSTQRDELKDQRDYYTKFLTDTGDYDYVDIIEWIGKDVLDIPFGGCAELGRLGDKPAGELRWIELLDGGTLFPTLNRDWPVGQQLKELAL